jgi:hypothetical protein
LICAGELVVLCEAAWGQGWRTGELIETCTEAVAEGLHGHELSRRVTDLIDQSPQGDFPSLCAFGPVAGGVIVIVNGHAELILQTEDDEELHYDQDTGVTVIDGELARTVTSARAVINGDEIELRAPWPAPLEMPVEPEPVTGTDGANAPEEDDLVLGVYCRRGHFNDPHMSYCTVCGISMAQATRHRVWGKRPALGVLVLDDGTLLPLVTEHVFGRVPERDGHVRAGRAVPIRLPGTRVSKVHARIVFDGWNVSVVDAGSTNGTFVCGPGAPSWIRLEPGVGVPLKPGMVLAFGDRQVRYHSYRAQSVDFSALEPLSAGK